MDNALLIIAGDAIDSSIGVMFGLSTMCAAAIGNLISDNCQADSHKSHVACS